ncbi:MAG: diacylglycerol kinase family lipid kinase [Clostridia bacterium]|nr:diacylglycerol kinase family lipid kinase [Clostridia bacterium]
MKKLLLIINPVAGKMKTKNALFDIIKVFSDNDFEVTVKITAFRGHGTQIAETEHKNYDILVCCGGDGTLNEVVKGLVKEGSKTPIGYIPAGSTNDFANSIGLPLEIKKAALAISKGKEYNFDIGAFKDTIFTYIASFGVFTSASYNTSQSLKNVLGHLAYILEGMKDLSALKSTYVKFEADGKTYEGDYIFGGIANSTSVGGIVKLKKELVDMSDGLFEVVLVKYPKNIVQLNEIVFAIATSDFKKTSMIEYFNASEIKVTTEEKLSWTVDGEYADGSGSFNIKNLKQRLTLIK